MKLRKENVKTANLGVFKLKKTSLLYDLITNRTLYLMALPGILFYIIFNYIPMLNVIIAFQDYTPALGIFGSPWVGFKHFERFFSGMYFGRVLKNTLGLSVYGIAASFWFPIILALLLNELKSSFIKRTTQTLTYIPHFISTVVICGLITDFTMKDGLINNILVNFGVQRANLLMKPELFKSIYVFSGIWQSAGWASIIYCSSLSGIDPTYYEAARIDGASRWKQALHITLPELVPVMVTVLILNVGSIMNVGFEKVFLLMNSANKETADVIATYVYEKGLVDMNFSFSAATGLFNAVVNMILVFGSNYFANKLTGSGLW